MHPAMACGGVNERSDALQRVKAGVVRGSSRLPCGRRSTSAFPERSKEVHKTFDRCSCSLTLPHELVRLDKSPRPRAASPTFSLTAFLAYSFLSTAPVLFQSFMRGYLADGYSGESWEHVGVGEGADRRGPSAERRTDLSRPTGLLHAMCDTTMTLWSETVFTKQAYIFYLSKVSSVERLHGHFGADLSEQFYEVIDTAIILAKGKKVGMLQSYHHTGAIWTMFAGVRTSATPIWIFVCFNSFIHSVMYCELMSRSSQDGC